MLDVHGDGARDHMRQTEQGIGVRIPPSLALAGDAFLRIQQGRCAASFRQCQPSLQHPCTFVRHTSLMITMSPTAYSVLSPPAAFVTDYLRTIIKLSHVGKYAGVLTNNSLNSEKLKDSDWKCHLMYGVTLIVAACEIKSINILIHDIQPVISRGFSLCTAHHENNWDLVGK